MVPGQFEMHSGIIDWEIDLKHLENQMNRKQVGCAIGMNVLQKKGIKHVKSRKTNNEFKNDN